MYSLGYDHLHFHVGLKELIFRIWFEVWIFELNLKIFHFQT